MILICKRPVSASIATAIFNQAFMRAKWKNSQMSFEEVFNFACFDSHVFTIPDHVEVMNYFRWRCNDCTRNSVSMLAQSVFSHKQLHGKSANEQKRMLEEEGILWDDLPEGAKYGRIISKKESIEQVDFRVREKTISKEIKRSRWATAPASNEKEINDKIVSLIPLRGQNKEQQ